LGPVGRCVQADWRGARLLGRDYGQAMEEQGVSLRHATSVRWDDLPLGARLFRVAHAVWGAFNVAALVWIWWSGLRRHRDRLVFASMALLSAEGVALVIGRGDCPFGPFQARLGDPVPMFELVLPPRAAKAAIPALTAVSLAGFAAVLLRPPWKIERARQETSS
jgi:hypothetical protein